MGLGKTLNRQAFGKAYKWVLPYCREIWKDKKNFNMTLYGKEYDVRYSLIYVMSLFSTSTGVYTDALDVMTLEDAADRQIWKVNKRKISEKNSDESGDKLVDSGMFSYMDAYKTKAYGKLTYDALTSGKEESADWLARAILSTKSFIEFDILGCKDLVVLPATIHFLICYTWASQFMAMDKLARIIHDKVNKANTIVKLAESIVDFDEAIALLDPNQKEKDLVKEYVELWIDSDGRYAFYNTCDSFIDAYLKRAKGNKKLSENISKLEKILLDSNSIICEYEFRGYLSRKHITRYLVLLLCASIADSVGRTLNVYLMLSYTYRLVKTGRLVFSEEKMDALQNKIIDAHTIITYYEMYRAHITICELFPKVLKDIASLKQENAKVLEEREQNKEKTKELRRLYKDVQKEVDRLKGILRGQEHELSRYKESSTYSKEYVVGLESKISTLQDQKSKLMNEAHELQRSLGKRDKEIASIHEKLDRAESDYLDLVEENDKLKKRAEDYHATGAISSIDLACYINAIKHKKIALIGGDVVHERLPRYGLTNIRCYKASKRTVTLEDIVDKDLVVIFTGFLGHSTKDSVVQVVKEYNIPTIMFNNQNIDLLVYEIFKEIYK